MKTNILFTALALIIGLQFTNAQNLISNNKPNLEGLPPISNWEIVTQNVSQSDLFAIQFIDDNQGWAVGNYGTLIYTIDAGFTWREHNFGLNVDLYDIYFLNESSGFAVGVKNVGPQTYGIVFKTIDGGQNWELSYQSKFHMVINSIAFTDDNNGFLAGYSYGHRCSSGIILRTDDAGNSWENVPVSIPISEVDNIMFNTNVGTSQFPQGWATGKLNVGPGELAVILKSEDGGSTWEPSYTDFGSKISFSDIHFNDLQNGVAVGQSGVVLTTNDAGKNWTTHKFDQHVLNAGLIGMHDYTCVIGDNGAILSSTGNSEDWVREYTLTSNHLTSICRTPGDFVWIAGYGGTLLRSFDPGCGENQEFEPISTHGTLKHIEISDQAENSTGPLVNHKNFPNPFQSLTSISFEIDLRVHVKLDIYNLNGKLIATLKDQVLESGYYDVMFNANDLPPGIYTYRLKAGNQVENGKMIK